MTKNIILAFLKVKELTAYDIKKAMEHSIAYLHSSSLGSINPSLKKLEKQNYVVCKEVIENHRVKKYYKITKSGLEEYKNWQNEPIKIGRIKEEALVRLFFMGDNDVDTRKKLIKDYLNNIKNIQNTLIQEQKKFSNIKIADEFADKARFQMATLNFGVEYYQFTYNWFQNLLNSEKK